MKANEPGLPDHTHEAAGARKLLKDRRGTLLYAILFLFIHPHCTAQIKPYRVLLVISNQWKDPRSFLVSGGGEFQTMVTLFKSWGIPFDILRLDQVAMDPNQFTV